MYSSAFKTSNQDLGGTYIAPEISMVLRVQISELERSDFNYVNLFGPETVTEVFYMSCLARKLVFGISDHVRHKPGCAATEYG